MPQNPNDVATVELVRRAIISPGVWTAQQPGEQLERWQARAVLAAIATKPATENIEDRITAAYTKLAKQHGDLVGLVRLRIELADIDRATLDQTLKAMDRARVIHLDPDPNRKALPPEAHEAAIRIGGEDKHFITAGHR